MQRLLNFSPWDQDAARDALARYVARAMGDPAAVLAVHETGFLKKGRMPAGVARMYAGTAGRVENCQVGVFAAYITPDGGRALADKELYLPQKWMDERDRCPKAGIGDDVTFATKPELAWEMISRARGAGLPFSWVADDEVYGGNPGLRSRLERRASPVSWPPPATTSSRWRPAACAPTRPPAWSRATAGSA
jgi:SRSO17 transposase